MKIAYFDCFAGISGNMILGALIDAGLPFKELQNALNKLPLKNFTVTHKKAVKQHIGGTYVDVKTTERQPERNLKEILSIIDSSKLENNVKETSGKIFNRIAHIESRIHKIPVEKIHFHEVSGVDCIVDIVGSVWGLRALGVKKILSSPVNLGSGMVATRAGAFPVPGPATAELLKHIPVYSSPGIQKELTTPTGAAILSTLCENYTSIPLMNVEKIGYGAGSHALPIPNLLRIIIGEEITGKSENTAGYEQDEITVLETNIDDMPPQHYEFVLEKLFSCGALDAFLKPVIMKKSRPGILLTVLCEKSKTKICSDILFEHTTTFGVRLRAQTRLKLPREIKNIKTKYGTVRVKFGMKGGKVIKAQPEYEDCKKIALQKNIPIQEILNETKKKLKS